MGFDEFLVVLNPHQPVYFPGQNIRGYVKVKVSSEVSCRELKVTTKGKGEVRWSERRGKTTHHYSSEEEYMRQSVTVWDGRCEYSYPFHFILPHNIPSSFEATHGKVRYQVKVVADKPWSIDQSTKIIYSVNHLYDLNFHSLSRNPLYNEKEKTVCCCCCTRGPISLAVSAPRSGYVPGENIIINGHIQNHSNSTIKYTEAKIVQNIEYITSSKTKEEHRTVQRVYRPQILPGGNDVWANVPLPVPAVPASQLKHCNIIDINYTFVFVAKLGTCKTAEVVSALIIGSIPLHGTYPAYVPPVSAAEVGGTSLATTVSLPYGQSLPNQPATSLGASPNIASAPLASHEIYRDHEETRNDLPRYNGEFRDDPPPYPSTFMPDDYKDIPPPSYDSCVFSHGQNGVNRGPRGGTTGRDSDDDENDFAPRYVTYSMGETVYHNYGNL
ncbi:Arrestin domain-containing protein 3-like 1 [Homarus americanus]|uniref:Arrestin domain-containing protein 3-like 1 n=1 Tax=Homarus americanus TaxID=6706 RepID=A0A8J5K240_HOMAM|nr:Arrestin domain-containing protein 3-like 1 [Homarus americanus]